MKNEVAISFNEVPSLDRVLSPFVTAHMKCAQVPLMGVVDSAVRALDAHRGDARVARVGLDFLALLATDTENKVWASQTRDVL